MTDSTPPTPPTLGTPRRRLLADAAISTLARSGMRGLTHRAVDETAGLPPGTCSAYFRTRQALLQAAVERLAETDLADIDAGAGAPTAPGSTAPDGAATAPDGAATAPDGPAALDGIADLVAGLVEHLATTGRERTLARYELVLEATRRPELGAVLAKAADRHRALIEGILAAWGIPLPAAQAPLLLACLDGLLHEHVVGLPGAPFSRTEVRAAALRLLQTFTR
ncbi:TetR/AcrR family transcriptional regulator [Actinomadura violacea]|uniref:TetR family transcriptional regulator n=1 Tax=Actinomadura violacea TaxID=2819934 RepID=A0ABS3RMU1_9ACTN|nr:TetR/AcrR family transcriptional regulator [Actinomadura violacea]MBO2458069.1 TetR family transcriptional regulator [Actinomadura violacea]